MPSGVQSKPDVTRVRLSRRAACRVGLIAFASGEAGGDGSVGVLSLRPGMQVHVAAEAERQARPGGQQGGGEVERDPVEVAAQEAAQPHVAQGHQRERRQEVLAELAIRDPRRASGGTTERQRVDEDRAPGAELDVVGARVPEREAGRDGPSLDVEGQERRRLELPEGPLVGIRDERQRLGADDGHGPRRVGGDLERSGLVRDQQAGRLEAGEEPGALERRPLLGRDAVDLPIQDAVAAEDEAARVAPGTRIRLGLGGGHSWLLTSAAASGAGRLAAAEAIHEAADLVAQHERGGDERGDHRLDREAARTGVDVGEDDVHQRCLNEF